MLRNQPGQKLTVFAYARTTNQPVTGVGASLSAYQSVDFEPWRQLTDVTATEEDVTKAPGFYLFDLLKSETDGGNIRFSANSTNPDVILECLPPLVEPKESSPCGVSLGGDCGMYDQLKQQTVLLQQLLDRNY